MPEPILEVHDITCGYDTFQLKDIRFSQTRGEIIGIIGPNGSGKSTLLKAIARAIGVSAGSIFLMGEKISRIPQREIAKRMAVVSQAPAYLPLTVEEYVLLGRIPHQGRWQLFESRRDREMALSSLKLTDTEHLRDKKIGEISGGERQLVFIARALCQEPRLLVLDEPTAFLDISHQVAIMDLLLRLNREQGLSVLLTLHDLNLAGEYCSRLIMLDGGRMHAQGTPGEVLTYQNIETVYKTIVIVRENPLSGRPFVILVSRHTPKGESIPAPD